MVATDRGAVPWEGQGIAFYAAGGGTSKMTAAEGLFERFDGLRVVS
jgi:hypothetical protein